MLAIVAVALYESKEAVQVDKRHSREHTYEAFLIISILLALVVLIVTCLDIERLTGKTFLVSDGGFHVLFLIRRFPILKCTLVLDFT